jgi:hypothetical protein
MPDWSVAVTHFPPRLTCIGSSSMSLHTAVTALLGIQHPVIVGEAIDLVGAIEPAADILKRMVKDVERLLREAS